MTFAFCRNYAKTVVCLFSETTTFKMSSKSVLILLGFLAGLAASFEIKTFRPKSLVVDEGASIELYCQVDGYYEWCTFKRLNDGKICDFEWKREKWDVDVLQCSDFAGRMTRTGRLKGLS